MEAIDLTATGTDWSAIFNQLGHAKIYFGHMSVGNNILEGVRDILEKYPDHRIDIVRGNDPQLMNTASLVHTSIGKNGDPFSKIDAFARMMRNGFGGRADIAMFKFCFVDIHAQTELQAVFEHYASTMQALAREFPATAFVHITAPVTTLQKGPKALIKRILGMDIGLEDNLARKKFNSMLVDAYAGQQPVFDLAGAESTYSDGSREFRTFRGEKVYLMIPNYTYDRGHLSEEGRTKVARAFLLFLASL